MQQRSVGSFTILLALAIALILMGSCGREFASSEAESVEPDSQSPAQTQAATIPLVHLSPVFNRLKFERPVFITHAGDDTNRIFVVEQAGRILVFENRDNVAEAKTFLDIASQVRRRHNEEGLLSLVFHPDYKQNGQFFVYYSVSNPKRNRISRFNASPTNPDSADAGSEHIMLEVEQPWGNHNGSTLLFGSDGFLYASFGDGGAANDPDLTGQDLQSLLAKIIRIDVDRAADGRSYAIPSDNPFISRSSARPEIWAYGLRNVWRMSFDRQTGELWAGDVGQDAWEEIDLIVKGGNYGWNLREGKHDFPDGIRRLNARGKFEPPDPLIEPVIDYPHRDGLSVTGGYVYRGQRNKRLQGVYAYADYATRTIWGLRYENGAMTAHRRLTGGANSAHITSFGEDQAGELYVCAFERLDRGPGRIYRIVEN